MGKKYEDKLLRALKDRQEWTDYHGVPLLVKNLPDCDEKGIANLRKMFNAVKSVPCVESDIYMERRTVRAKDGYLIPVRIYKKHKDDQKKPVLYYIHGGGFFGGSPDVVEESVKMFVAGGNRGQVL